MILDGPELRFRGIGGMQGTTVVGDHHFLGTVPVCTSLPFDLISWLELEDRGWLITYQQTKKEVSCVHPDKGEMFFRRQVMPDTKKAAYVLYATEKKRVSWALSAIEKAKPKAPPD